MDPDYLVRVLSNSLLTHLDPIKDQEYAQDLLLVLLQRTASKDYNTVLKKNVFPNTLLHRQKCRLLQSCTILWNLVLLSGSAKTDYYEQVHELLWLNIGQESMPSTRCYFEWMLARGYRHEFFNTEELMKRVLNYHGSAAMSISVLTISYLVAKTLPVEHPFRATFMDSALPYFIHNNHAVRMFIIFIWERLTVGCKIDNSAYANLSSFIHSSDHCQKFMDKLKEEHLLKDFDIDKDVNVQFLFCELPKRLGMAVDEFIAFASFSSVESIDGHVPITVAERDYTRVSTHPSENIHSDVDQDNGTGTQTRFQQKMVPVELAEAEQELQGIRRAEALLEKTRSGRIIILASFVDKIPNLAGLARTCEVLGAASLCVPSLSVLSSPDFQAVCMTADRWLDIQQVREEQVVEYLNRKRSEGFRIVAIEQSSESQQLSQYRFHRDTVLVLGNERSGVPAEVLHLVDDCVEIPQFGMVRSLNVHVTGSIVLWEGRKQLSNL